MKNQFIQKYLKWTGISFFIGIFAGISSTLFLYLLDYVTKTRFSSMWLIWFLPLAGFVVGFIYDKFGQDVVGGSHLILDEIHKPKKIISFKMAPFILFGTLMTHLFGGSAGREGTAVQMGASLADQLNRFFKIEFPERKIILMAGMAAGFGSAIGAPLAGAIFGMEVLRRGRLRLVAWYECLVASFIACAISHFLKAPHSVYPEVQFANFEFKDLFWVAVAGLFFGLAAILFVQSTHFVEWIFRKISHPPLRPMIAGLLLVSLYWLEGTYRFTGLGIEEIRKSMLETSSLFEPVAKTFFTSLTIGSGFKGGEFIPLVFVGATLGSFLASFIPLSTGLLSAVGFGSVFGAASKTPIACSVMIIEIFGISSAPYALISCLISYYVSGVHTIYRSQL